MTDSKIPVARDGVGLGVILGIIAAAVVLLVALTHGPRFFRGEGSHIDLTIQNPTPAPPAISAPPRHEPPPSAAPSPPSDGPPTRPAPPAPPAGPPSANPL